MVSINSFSDEQRRFSPSADYRARSRVPSLDEYQRLYRESVDQPEQFWRRETEQLVFDKPWTKLLDWDLPHAKWFTDGTLNITKSCLDRFLGTPHETRTALIWESEPGDVEQLSYGELYRKVIELAAALRQEGVSPGDRVAIYMGMVPEVVIGMLACARIGATHSVVFGGFAADSLKDRINDCEAVLVLTQDGALRRGDVVPLKATVDHALEHTPSVRRVLVYRRLGQERCPIEMKPERDRDWYEAVRAADPEQGRQAAELPAEHPLFILYTSGSTGKPKGVMHTAAGYLAGVHVSSRYAFDLQDGDVYWCTADVGWITGHSYIVYGPLSNGVTCVLYEGAPNFPDWGRFWQIIDRHRVSILYTAPTAIRAFIKAGDEWLKQSSLDSLRLLGTVGEPINPEAWVWYHEQVGKGRCPIIDTWWQTETGSIMMTTLPGAADARPGACGLPFFGVEPAVVNKDGSPVEADHGGLLVIKRPWPSMLRTIWGDDERYRQQYWTEVEGCYFTGDGARQDADGYFHVMGRIDDVLNVAGHRLGTAEVESFMVAHPAVAEAAAVPRPDELKGQVVVVFVTLKPGHTPSPELASELADHIASEIGKFARPHWVRFADGLPKTRSGKIMRRLLKDVAAGREVKQDLSTLEDLNVLAKLRGTDED